MSKTVFLYVTAPDRATASAIARTLIEEKLAACANILGETVSIYEWEGRIEEAGETAMLIKTSRAQARNAGARIVALHPFEVPCVAALPIDPEGSHGPFLDWIAKATKA